MAKSDRTSFPGKPSKESTPEQLRLARDQGDRYKAALEAMRHETGRGASIEVRDMVISYSEENAEGMYEWQDDQLVWRNPDPEQNAHLEIAVQDAHDGRFIPYLDVKVTVFESGKDEPLFSVDLPFLWHPWLYHYGSNVHLPHEGMYDLLVNVSELRIGRHDMENGDRYTHAAEVRFERAPLVTGQKLN